MFGKCFVRTTAKYEYILQMQKMGGVCWLACLLYTCIWVEHVCEICAQTLVRTHNNTVQHNTLSSVNTTLCGKKHMHDIEKMS